MDLTGEEVRVLGSLIEKERTTPDQYPLSTNALRVACNQKTNRQPVVDYPESTIDQVMLALRQRGLARTVHGGGRVDKHKHVLDEMWGLDEGELALLGVLMLRGPQTPAELRTRSERLHAFSSSEEVMGALASLAERDEPLVCVLERLPGQKEARWAHLLTGEVDEAAHAATAEAVAAASGGDGGRRSALTDRLEELESEVAALRTELEALRDRVDVFSDRLDEAGA